MLEFLSNHCESILTLIGGFLGGCFCVKIFSKENCNNTKTNQKNIIANGDVAGRDINKK